MSLINEPALSLKGRHALGHQLLMASSAFDDRAASAAAEVGATVARPDPVDCNYLDLCECNHAGASRLRVHKPKSPASSALNIEMRASRPKLRGSGPNGLKTPGGLASAAVTPRRTSCGRTLSPTTT
jgi:hypothetical protein